MPCVAYPCHTKDHSIGCCIVLLTAIDVYRLERKVFWRGRVKALSEVDFFSHQFFHLAPPEVEETDERERSDLSVS